MSTQKTKQKKSRLPFIGKRKQLPERVVLGWYPYETWQKLYPDSNRTEWEEAEYPDDIAEYVSKSLSSLRRNGFHTDTVQTVVVIPVDEEYDAWLERNGKEHIPEDDYQSMEEYCEEVSEEDAFRLMKKHGIDRAIRFVGIPILLISDALPTDFHMSKETQTYLREYLNRVYMTETYVVPYYVRADIADNEKSAFREMARAWFTDGVNVVYDKYAKREYTNNGTGNLAMAYIPAFLSETFQSAVFPARLDMKSNVRLYFVRYPHHICLDPSIVEEFGNKDAKDVYDVIRMYNLREWELLDVSYIRNDIQADSVTLLPSPVTLDSAVMFENAIMQGLEKEKLIEPAE